ncbi:hypothetical protein HDZ31DRAFT_29083 [Schizophyllum fasciatum]
MQKIGDDQWTAEGVVSTFNVDATQRLSDCDESETCGIGWRFTIGTSTQDSASRRGASMEWSPNERPLVYVGFDPACLSGATGLGQAIVKVKSSTQETPLSVRVDLRSNAVYNNRTGNFQFGCDIGEFTYASVDALREATLVFTVSFSSPDVHLPVRPLPSTATQSIVRSLAGAVSGADLNDVEFVLPSRKRDEEVTTYRAVYGNREALKGKSDYLDALLFNVGFVEGRPQPFGQYQKDGPAHHLEYADDSDIDDEDAEAVTQTETNPPQGLNPVSSERTGRVVRINDFASQTWKALVLYLYTGEITFRKLVSSGADRSEISATACSPKSMYRVAHMLEMKDLQHMCMQSINSQLTSENIVEELFSTFTARYPDVMKAEAAFFKMNYARCADRRKAMMLKVAKGEMPHCGEVMNTVMDLLS